MKNVLLENYRRFFGEQLTENSNEDVNGDFNVSTEYDKDDDAYIHTISNFSLDLGNNYNYDHFIDALQNEQPDIVDYIETEVSSGDEVIFLYDGNYGKHKDVWIGNDLMDFLR